MCSSDLDIMTKKILLGAAAKEIYLVSASKCKELQLRDVDTVFLRTPSTLLRLRMLKDPFLDREKRHRPFSRRRDDRTRGQRLNGYELPHENCYEHFGDRRPKAPKRNARTGEMSTPR